jgi:HD-GYP domain-containing protein (c-di-GMP phosphodiesterase class II)
MSTQQGLAERVAALRQRLDEIGRYPETDPQAVHSPSAELRQLRRELQHLEGQNFHLDARLAELCPELATHDDFGPLPRQLAWKTRRLLLRGRETLEDLKSIAEALTLTRSPEGDPLPTLYRQTLAIGEMTLRSVRNFPESTAEQLRLCEGLEPLLDVVERRVAGLRAIINRRRMEEEQIESLAGLLTALVQGRPVLLRSFQAVAERLVSEAEQGAPLRWLASTTDQPACWTATHALHVAQVLARIAPRDHAVPGRTTDVVLAGLLHDAGMAAMPVDLLAQPGPLNDEQRRLLESHIGLAAEAVARLAPHEGWLIDAIRAHHERIDGTGYPTGAQGLQIPPLARLLAVADTYAALTRPRPYRNAFGPRSALTETLMEAEKGRLDMARAELLLGLSFYPVGTIVELSDGQLGRVAATHPMHGDLSTPARPVIELLMTADGETLPWAEHVDLAAGEGRHIVRSLTIEEARERMADQHWSLV